MTKIQIEKINIFKVLEKMCLHLNGHYTQDVGEGTMVLNNENGKGTISAFEFIGGISCLAYNITFTNEHIFEIEEYEDRHLYFNYILEGYFQYRIGEHANFKKVNKLQNMIALAHPEHITYIKLPKNVKLRYLAINIDYTCSNIRFEKPLMILKNNLKNDISENQNASYVQFNYLDYSILESVEEYYKLNATGMLRSLLIESIVIRILGYQLEEYTGHLNSKFLSNISQKDQSKILLTIHFIEDNISKKMSLKKLAEMSGMSDKQFQRYFKKNFNKSPIQFITDLKLDKSRELLLNSDFNIAEIADNLGFANPSYFAKIFKRKYHLTPKAYQKTYKII
ncbi:helix-turn-helix protein [Mariniflexile fucanivorans]|uniref:Helix-turn-helix protein n=1 Tax=Mariniflexile fucanivorans TaxID=264023 RepID=A0A4R1RNS0_9FLAO|nr:AraC family transcriptional regulator [Mariniflexile fucanivorans]TCL67502.1 helix-turn-helix protein [Mariniflexile fucanivorans]